MANLKRVLVLKRFALETTSKLRVAPKLSDMILTSSDSKSVIVPSNLLRAVSVQVEIAAIGQWHIKLFEY